MTYTILFVQKCSKNILVELEYVLNIIIKYLRGIDVREILKRASRRHI